MVSKKDKKLSKDIKKKRERLYAKMAETGCIACHLSNQTQKTPTEIHHLRAGMGLSQRGVRCIPLCIDHHRGSACGYHGVGRRRFEGLYGTEEYLLDKWISIYNYPINWDEYS
tara:strand:+ start:10181 stop:10519 length:339 start_codon:yes stop_codon:yes gene_type:complete